MTRPSDDEWRAIVENFGAVPDADELAAELTPEPPTPMPVPVPVPEETPVWNGESWRDEGRYVPPPPPPLPTLPAIVKAAWICLLGGPALLVACLFIGYRPPVALVTLGLAAMVASFVFLIFRAPRAPREPWEDGAQV
jgi:hypothetical protein